MVRRFALPLLPRSPRAGERWLALTPAAWGLWLLLPLNTFGAGFGATIGGHMLDENGWGLLALALGVFSMIGAACCRPRVRVAASVTLTLFWMFLAATIIPTGATSAVLYLMLGLRQATFIYESVLAWRGG